MWTAWYWGERYWNDRYWVKDSVAIAPGPTVTQGMVVRLLAGDNPNHFTVRLAAGDDIAQTVVLR